MMKLRESFDADVRISRTNAEAARAFFKSEMPFNRYVLGRNAEAVACLERGGVDGLVDDYFGERAWHGVPVLRAEELPAGATVINCSLSVRPLSAQRRLEAIKGIKVLSYMELVRENPDLPLPSFVQEARKDVVSNQSNWDFVEGLLQDKASAEVFRKIMLFRLTGDIRYMEGFSVRFDEQYFDCVVKTSEQEVFVDCGAYDGDTTLEFCRRQPTWRRVYAFEPAPVNFEAAARRLQALSNVSLIPMGVSNEPGTLAFDSAGGSASSVDSKGGSTIRVVTIDEYITEPVTFIKMDLEGWELKALTGARRHILEDGPKLAIAVYHRASDVWGVARYVLGLRNDYDVYLRHYSEGWSETIMYFIPRR